MDNNIWPKVPTVHDLASHYTDLPPVWRTVELPLPTAPEEFGCPETFRSCSHCGSMHPGDLYEALMGGAHMDGSDWKYGWPHKFYLESVPVPPEFQGVTYCSSYTYINGVKTDLQYARIGPTTHGKFYSIHLLDAGYNDTALAMLMEEISIRTKIFFKIDSGKLGYTAPSHGYQA